MARRAGAGSFRLSGLSMSSHSLSSSFQTPNRHSGESRNLHTAIDSGFHRNDGLGRRPAFAGMTSMRVEPSYLSSLCADSGLRRNDGLGRRPPYLPSLMKSAIRSAIIIVVALVLARMTSGITEASTTRRFAIPYTRQYWSTTAIRSEPGPILQVPEE